jgi:hypothetical protein
LSVPSPVRPASVMRGDIFTVLVSPEGTLTAPDNVQVVLEL